MSKAQPYQSYYDYIILATEMQNPDTKQISEIILSFYETGNLIFRLEYETHFKKFCVGEETSESGGNSFLSFKQLLQVIDEMLFTDLVQHSFSYIFCTYGKELFFRTIPGESAREGLHPQSYFLQFVDLRHELFTVMTRNYPQLYPQMNNDYAALLPLMCREIGIQEDSQIPSPLLRQHQMFKKLLHYVCSVTQNQLSSPIIMSPEHIYGQKLWMQEPWYNIVPDFNQPDAEVLEDPSKERNYYFRLRGIPYQSREKDIQEFFNLATKMEKEDIALIFEKNGLFSGEAIVQVHGEKAYLRVKSLNLKRMGARYIEILDSTEREFQSAIESFIPSNNLNLCFSEEMFLPKQPPPPILDYQDDDQDGISLMQLNKSGILRIRGLPFRVTPMELAIFFSGMNVDQKHIKIIYDDDGRPSGEAFCIMDTPEKAEQAKQIYHRKIIGHRYIEIFFSNPKEFLLYQERGKLKSGGFRGYGRNLDLKPMDRSGSREFQQVQQQMPFPPFYYNVTHLLVKFAPQPYGQGIGGYPYQFQG